MSTRRPAAFLSGFDSDQMERLLWNIERVPVEPGEVLIHEGQSDKALFIVLEGRYEAVRGKQVLRVIRGGHVFGELAFFDASPRSASVIAREEGVVLRMTEECFAEIRKRNPDLACALALEVGRLLSEKFRELDRQAHG